MKKKYLQSCLFICPHIEQFLLYCNHRHWRLRGVKAIYTCVNEFLGGYGKVCESVFRSGSSRAPAERRTNSRKPPTAIAVAIIQILNSTRSLARSLALRHLPKGSNVDRRGPDAYYILAYGSVARRPDLKGNVCVLSVGIPLLRVVQNIRT